MRLIVMGLAVCGLMGGAGAAITLDESPAGPGDWGYRPDDGATAELNPPPFTWRPVKGVVGYVLQVATDPDFNDLVYEFGPTRWTAHCPSRPFPAGTHYWRYAGRDADGAQSDWSTVRSFVVPADAPLCPRPTLEELLERMPADHPRLFFRGEDIERFRELSEGPLSERFQGLVEAADKLLAEPPDTTEPPKYPEGTVRLSNEWRVIWWGNRVRVITVTDAAATLAFVYRLTGEEKYGRAARDLVMAFAEWDPKGSTNYGYNDEAAMPALYYPSRAYTWARPMFSDEDVEKLAAVMRVRGRDCFNSLQRGPHLWRPFNSHLNRAWHKLGELAIAFRGDIPEAETWLDFAMTVLYTTYPVWSDEDGGWHEGISYWSSYLSRFLLWSDVIRSAFDIDVFERPFFRRAGDFGMYLMPPGTRYGGFGDLAEGAASRSIGGLMATLAAGADNPYWKWYADQVGGSLGSGYIGFMRSAYSLDLEARPPVDRPSSVCFRRVGVAVLNSNLLDAADNVQIHFKSSPYFGTISHGYNANNAFLLGIGGHPVLVRTGKRDVHGSEHHREWMWHTKSDNALLVNGEGQIKHSPQSLGRILVFDTSPTVDVVAGEAGAAYPNLDRWTRRIVFFKPHAVLIHDALEAPEPSTFQWLLHTVGPMELADNAVSWEGEPGRVDVRFLWPAGLALSQTGEFDPPPAAWRNWDLNEWHLTADTGAPAQRQEFLTLITVNNAAVSVAEPVDLGAREGARTIRLTLPGGEAAVRLGFEPGRFAVTAPGYSREFSTE